MIDALQMMHLIKSSLEKLGLKYASHDAMMLVYRTGLVESKYKYLSQKGSDIARGFWQCEPWVAVSLCKDYLQYRDSLMKKVADVCYLDWKYFTDPTEEDWKQILTTNLTAGIILCRLHYWRVPKPLPSSLEEQARYWKNWYNTAKGAGTTEHFQEIVIKYS
tara:strand:+ start:1583 stop:2068 length:486 start_codon:yes stop_codon:yes gene_type:complete